MRHFTLQLSFKNVEKTDKNFFTVPFPAPPHLGFVSKSYLTLKELQCPNLTVPLGAIKSLILSASLAALHPASLWQEVQVSTDCL